MNSNPSQEQRKELIEKLTTIMTNDIANKQIEEFKDIPFEIMYSKFYNYFDKNFEFLTNSYSSLDYFGEEDTYRNLINDLLMELLEYKNDKS